MGPQCVQPAQGETSIPVGPVPKVYGASQAPSVTSIFEGKLPFQPAINGAHLTRMAGADGKTSGGSGAF